MGQSVNVYGLEWDAELAERLRQFFRLGQIVEWEQFAPQERQLDTLYLSKTRIPGMLAYSISTMKTKREDPA